MKNSIIFVLVVSIFLITPVFGQEIESKQEKEPKKIIIEDRTSLFPSYKYDTGKRIIDLKAQYLEKMVLSINDEEATYHLKRSKKLSSIGIPLSYSGGLLIAIPVLWQFGGGDFNQFIFLSGCGLTASGVVLALKSDKERLKSVERYNQVVENKWGIFFQYSPENKQLGLRLSNSF